ncbi:MAG: hypothetical protein A2Y16_03730 [Tenericutes bacterium GWF2_57_13]|nr:MAG: hypothetical protein A2Y16_03730 [Tenericutes bacterium GWF2_57_13]
MFLMYLPIIVIAIQSFNESTGLIYQFTGFTFDHWKNVLTFNLDSSLMKAISTTLLVALLATGISTVLGTIIAIGIHSLPQKKRQGMVFLNQVPILNADIITGISLMFVFKIVAEVIPGVFGIPSLLIAHVFFCIPYVVLSVLPKLAELDDNLYDAALDLYCKPAVGITKVIIPAIMPGILTGMLIAFTMSIDDFLISFFNAGQVNNLSIYIYGGYNRRLAPEVYAYNTILSTVIIVALIAMYVSSSLKKRKNLKREPRHA